MNKNKNGKKNEFEANGTPSILNFDITGDVTRDITDIEANVTAAHTPHKRPATVNKPMHQARNSTASNFMDPMTQASNREKVIFTQQEDELNRKADLEEHFKKVSTNTHP